MSQPERTLVLVKPDGVERGLTGEILSRIERKGYQITELLMLNATPQLLAEHYEEHQGKEFFEPLVNFMASGPIVAAIFEGDRVIEGVRQLAGISNPTLAEAGTIRGDLGRDWGEGVQKNLIHASDSTLSAEREIELWFG
ncbi:MAG TPA: nucleoside-diphosphate kinase [Enteractinococcus helveticum]|uniref:Nucleoside diphosphate kinase n=1 Tax=Enteractinococcus helveticum TaxID=1837282 RepID=A0A921FLI2_9MICC|nr:nucleoside-diphosphate kinase [Enteractinococcus helveticum]HJF13844.1 nucleoside-diphosphate kinase [Enteractinococcus helveticum]